MLDGFYVFRGDGSTQYSVPFPRQALNALFNALAPQMVGTTPQLVMTVEHKNSDEPSWATAATFGTISSASATTVKSILGTGLKEEVRFTYTITATNGWEGFLLRMLAPAWFN